MLVHRVTWRSPWEIIADTNCRYLSKRGRAFTSSNGIFTRCYEYKDNFISIGSLIVNVCTLNDATLVHLDSSSVRITMTKTTLRRMFEFDGCIYVTFERLARLVDMIDAKYTRFSNIASENAIRDSNIFNGHQLVDCELLTLAFNTYKKRNDVITCE